MSGNDNLQAAKSNKDDHFFTRYEDIKKEVLRYDLKNKIVFCPCDTVDSNFTKFFLDNYDTLGLCGFIAAGLGDGFVKFNNFVATVSETNCFSEEASAILKIADIVITNPPFSIFSDIVDLLISNQKQFLILGSQNAVSYNSIFQYIQEDKLWLGYNYGVFSFSRPDGSVKRLGNICWYTNLLNEVREIPMVLNKDDITLQTYDNYDAVEIPKVKMIPETLTGKAGVPITFLNRYCPKQFRIIGKSDQLAGPVTVKGKLLQYPRRFYLNGKRLYERIVIEKVEG